MLPVETGSWGRGPKVVKHGFHLVRTRWKSGFTVFGRIGEDRGGSGRIGEESLGRARG
jgi:hypothetical protein